MAADSQINALVKKFARMLPGHSFFIADVSRKDVEFLRRPAMKMGIGIRIVVIEFDEIYQQRGVRIWREEGEYDEL